MLILGQDKDLLTDNLNLIIEETTFKDIGKVYVIQNEIYKIGYYATEERAKEVLQGIIEQYEYCQVLQEGHGISLSSGNNYVYAMPEK